MANVWPKDIITEGYHQNLENLRGGERERESGNPKFLKTLERKRDVFLKIQTNNHKQIFFQEIIKEFIINYKKQFMSLHATT